MKATDFPLKRLILPLIFPAFCLPVLEISEAYTSQMCSRCGKRGLRVRGLFTCPHCGLNLNADYNGARNILKRALGKLHDEPLSSAGACLTMPELLAEAKSQ